MIPVYRLKKPVGDKIAAAGTKCHQRDTMLTDVLKLDNLAGVLDSGLFSRF